MILELNAFNNDVNNSPFAKYSTYIDRQMLCTAYSNGLRPLQLHCDITS